MKLIYLYAIVVLSSCSSVLGITENKEYSQEDMRLFLRQNNIPDSIIYFIDKDYKNSLRKLSNDSFFLKDHLQPLQASYYNKDGLLISFHINCYAPGFPNLDWNHNNAMDVFPPKTQAPLDTLLKLQNQLTYLKTSQQNHIEALNDCDYLIVVYWAGFMKKQSKVLIDAVAKNLKLNVQNKKIKIIYVCTDNVFIK